MQPKPLPRILIADDESSLYQALQIYLANAGFEVTLCTDGSEAINALHQKQFDTALLDIKMPRVDGVEVLQFIKEHHPTTEVIMLTGINDIRTAVDCMKMGAFYYLTKPFRAEELLEIIQRGMEYRSLRLGHTLMHDRLKRITGDYEIIGTSDAITKILKTALKIAPSDSTVLIQGASGTGKELVAHFIHKNSARASQPFVPLNCASIPDLLFESELFGYEKGAFTDAKAQKQGLVELANGGTLFLDEVGDISLAVQPKLLRFIQTGEFRRVGGTIPLTSNIRVVSASNKFLNKQVADGSFREDLLYRLNVITLALPSLAERREDIPLLVEYFLANRYGQALNKTMSPEGMEVLMNYPWPGNIRELENVIERAILLSSGKAIQPRDLSISVGEAKPANGTGDTIVGSSISMEELERQHIDGVLRATRWNKGEAAKILGISLKTLYTKIATFRLVES